MLKANQLFKALKKDVYRNYLDGTCLFNMCPEKQIELYNDRFFVIEGYDLNFPPRRLIGLLIWDNERGILHGPQIVKHLFNSSDSNDSHPPECTIHKYAFITTETFQVELKVFIRDEAHRYFCISGFDDAALHMREISFNEKMFIVNNTN